MLPEDLDALLVRVGAAGRGWTAPRRHSAGGDLWRVVRTVDDDAANGVATALAADDAVARVLGRPTAATESAAQSPTPSQAGRMVCWALRPDRAVAVLSDWARVTLGPTTDLGGLPGGARLTSILLAGDRARRGVDSGAPARTSPELGRPGRAPISILIEPDPATIDLASALTEHLLRLARGFARADQLAYSLAGVAGSYHRFWADHPPEPAVDEAVAAVLKHGLMHLGHVEAGRI